VSNDTDERIRIMKFATTTETTTTTRNLTTRVT
jgi:hypothetical protein